MVFFNLAIIQPWENLTGIVIGSYIDRVLPRLTYLVLTFSMKHPADEGCRHNSKISRHARQLKLFAAVIRRLHFVVRPLLEIFYGEDLVLVVQLWNSHRLKQGEDCLQAPALMPVFGDDFAGNIQTNMLAETGVLIVI